MQLYSTNQYTRPSFKTTIDDKSTPQLFIPRQVIDEIRYLNERNKTREWSGVLFYTIEEGSINDMSSLKLRAQGILLKDIGTAAATSYEFSGDVVEYMDRMAEKCSVDPVAIYTNWKIGHHHSHQQMGVLPSTTDTEEIEDNIKNHVAYLTTITNNKMEISAFISVYAQIHFTNSYTIKDHTGQEHNVVNSGQNDTIFKYKVQVHWEDNVLVSDDFKQRYTEIDSKKVTPTTAVIYKKHHTNTSHVEREKEFRQIKLDLEEFEVPETDMDFDKMMLIDLIMHYDPSAFNISTITQALKMAERSNTTPYMKNMYFNNLEKEIDLIISSYAIDDITYEERDTQIRDMMDLLLDEKGEFAKSIYARLNNKLSSHSIYHG